jgi:ribonuclease HI
MEALEKAQDNYSIQLEWVKGHSEETGNELADALAKEGTLEEEEIDYPTLLVYAKQIIKECAGGRNGVEGKIAAGAGNG